MQRISCRRFFHKRIFPVLWFGGIGLFVALGILAPTPVPAPLLFLLPPVLAVIGYVVWRKFVADLADEEWDGGDWLLVRKDGREERIPFSNIINVNAALFVNPPRITLRLANPGIFGREVAFSPRRPSLNPFAVSPLVDDLIQRVDRARRD